MIKKCLFVKVDRVIKMAKAARTEMVQLSSGDLEFEEQVNNDPCAHYSW